MSISSSQCKDDLTSNDNNYNDKILDHTDLDTEITESLTAVENNAERTLLNLENDPSAVVAFAEPTQVQLKVENPIFNNKFKRINKLPTEKKRKLANPHINFTTSHGFSHKNFHTNDKQTKDSNIDLNEKYNYLTPVDIVNFLNSPDSIVTDKYVRNYINLALQGKSYKDVLNEGHAQQSSVFAEELTSIPKQPVLTSKLKQKPYTATSTFSESSYGARLMSKFGWKPGKGLGLQEDGIKSAITLEYEKDKEISTSNFNTGLKRKVAKFVTNNENSNSSVIVHYDIVHINEMHENLASEIGSLHEKYGNIEQVYIHIEKLLDIGNVTSSIPKVNAFVKFNENMGALKAKNELEGLSFKGKNLHPILYNEDLFKKSVYQ